jgi:hypothetical protein
MPRIVLWNPPAHRPAYRLMDWDGNVLEEGPMLTADEVYCDLCNADVLVRPVPVIDGHVVCLRCLQEIDPKWPEQIPLEVLLVWKCHLDEVNR